MSTQTLLLYVVTSLLVAVTPGPTMLLALSNSIAGVATGLGSLLTASEWLFHAMRVAGVLYPA